MNMYKERSGKKDPPDKDNMKRHWTDKMCNKFQKPTCKNGAVNDFILYCKTVEQKTKELRVILNGQRDSDGDDSDNEMVVMGIWIG